MATEALHDDTLALLVHRGALFVINHSGGKDSQAMTIYLRRRIPAAQLVIVHAELPEVDWEGIPEHIATTCGDIPVHYTRARKTFFEMVEHRGQFPSPKYRQCTSDLKRGPIERTVRQLSAARGCRLIVNCMGMRAEESSARSKLSTFKLNAGNSVAGREWYDWLPIHHLSTAEVFATIAEAGQEPHWAYAAGMSRLSCCFCIMSSKADLKTAARLQPALLQRYVAAERRHDKTMMMPVGGSRQFLDEIVAA
jgi:3'-phosphoadenosine 5'-phosphosulfate sulfotransferase (PAPS reductase)/FAD synthetase